MILLIILYLYLFLSGTTVLHTEENNLLNCSLDHSPIDLPTMQNTNLDLTFESFTIWEPAFSVLISVYVLPIIILPRKKSVCHS